MVVCVFLFHFCQHHVMSIRFAVFAVSIWALDNKQKNQIHIDRIFRLLITKFSTYWIRFEKTSKRFPIDAHELITFTRNFYVQTDLKSPIEAKKTYTHTHTQSRKKCLHWVCWFYGIGLGSLLFLIKIRSKVFDIISGNRFLLFEFLHSTLNNISF